MLRLGGAAYLGYGRSLLGLSGFELGFDGDVVAECFELFHSACFGLAGVDPGVEVRAWVAVELAAGEHVPRCDEHGVFDRDDSFHRGQRETPASVPSLLHDPPGHRLVEVERAGDSHVGLDVSETDELCVRFGVTLNALGSQNKRLSRNTSK